MNDILESPPLPQELLGQFSSEPQRLGNLAPTYPIVQQPTLHKQNTHTGPGTPTICARRIDPHHTHLTHPHTIHIDQQINSNNNSETNGGVTEWPKVKASPLRQLTWVWKDLDAGELVLAVELGKSNGFYLASRARYTKQLREFQGADGTDLALLLKPLAAVLGIRTKQGQPAGQRDLLTREDYLTAITTFKQSLGDQCRAWTDVVHTDMICRIPFGEIRREGPYK